MDDSGQKSEIGNQSLDTIQDGEVVVEEETNVAGADLPPSDPNSSALVLESLQSLIKENLSKVDRLKDELGKQKEMLDSALNNDETYKQHAEAAKVATKQKTATKSEILKRPENATLFARVKELAAEIAEIKESQGSYLQEYMRLSGSNEIETDDGQVLQIINEPRLVKRR